MFDPRTHALIFWDERIRSWRFYVSTTVRFRQSAALPWDTNAILGVVGWKGVSTNGWGSHALYFGNNAGGLTPQQLTQIIFSNPGGLPPGNYLERILDTGEVVPGQRIAV